MSPVDVSSIDESNGTEAEDAQSTGIATSVQNEGRIQASGATPVDTRQKLHRLGNLLVGDDERVAAQKMHQSEGADP